MAISERTKKTLAGASLIRQMFDKGGELKRQFCEQNVDDFVLGNPEETPEAVNETLIRILSQPKKGMHGYTPNA